MGVALLCFAGFGGPQRQVLQLSHAFLFVYNLTAGRVKLKLYKMKKSLFTAFAVGLSLSASVWAQVPSYVPTNGLVGYWPFNGNANDESGNGFNGSVSGATLTNDRFGNANKAYSFNGNNFIGIAHNNAFNMQQGTWSVWVKKNAASSGNGMYIFGKRDNSQHHITFNEYLGNGNGSIGWASGQATGGAGNSIVGGWHMLTIAYDQSISTNNFKYYFDGIQVGISTIQPFSFVNGDIRFGIEVNNSYWQAFNGLIDEGIIYNRILTNSEILQLYNGCTGNEITSQPINSSINAGSNAQFNVGGVAGSTYQWQNNPLNNGWQNINNNTNYSGATTNTLTVANTSVSNHNQLFRAIVNSGGCIDTSNVANIQITDTCITNVTVYDTLLTTVTDTLIINTTLSLPAPNNENTILIYPNPASDHITIDNGNFVAMAGYTIKIENNSGQQVFQSAINQAQFYVDLSTWTGNGLYFVHLIDPQNNTVTVRKIVLQ